MDYIVVGLQEEFGDTIKVLQKIIPNFLPKTKKKQLGEKNQFKEMYHKILEMNLCNWYQ